MVERIAGQFFEVVTHIKTSQKEVFLTFDDGPHPEITPWVLQELKKHKAKATFFCVGNNVLKYPETFQNILDEGHQVGNHTFSHKHGWKAPKKEYLADVDKAAEVIKSSLFRPPYGKITMPQYNALKANYKIIVWDVLSKDYDASKQPNQIIETVIQKTKNGSILVFHDSEKAEKNLKAVLPTILKALSEKGFSFSKLEEKKSVSVGTSFEVSNP